MSDLVCSECGRPATGGHPESCNGPDQRFVTRQEYAAGRPRSCGPVDGEEFRADREAARRAARQRGEALRAVQRAFDAVRDIPVTDETASLRAAALLSLERLQEDLTTTKRKSA